MNRTRRTVLALALALIPAALGGCSGSKHTWNDNSSLAPNVMYTCSVPSTSCQVITVVPSGQR